MSTRFTKKPDPSIKKNVLRARAEARKGRNTHASVVITSMLATLFAWALFTNLDAQALEAASRAATSNQATLTVAVPAQSAPEQQASTLQVPLRLELPLSFR